MKNVVISYSHKDARWLERLLIHLKPLEREGQIELWADTRIKPGAKWVEEIDSALAKAKIALLLVSADFLASDFIASKELPVLLQTANRGACRVLTVMVGHCLFSEIQYLQQFQAINSPGRPLAQLRKAEAEEWLVRIAQTVRDAVHSVAAGTVGRTDKACAPSFEGDPDIDKLIADVNLGDWDSAEELAIRVIAKTDSEGDNEVFRALLRYHDCPDDDNRFWAAHHTIESCVRLAPWLIGHGDLSRMATHENFSVRSSAACICMDMAHSAPDRVPIDLLLKLSVYDEDWYVEVPANAALKAMVRSFPGVLRVFFSRLGGEIPEERTHAAKALGDIADEEPGLLDPQELRDALSRLNRLKDKDAVAVLLKAIPKVRAAPRVGRYRYGL